jgi:hypothetical protein
MSDRVWRGVFLASAVFNFVVALSLAFDMSATTTAMGLEVARYDAFWSPIAAWFVALFGVLYLAVWPTGRLPSSAWLASSASWR